MPPITLVHAVCQTTQLSAVTCGAMGLAPGARAREFVWGAAAAERARSTAPPATATNDGSQPRRRARS